MVKRGHSRKYTQKNLVYINSWLFKNFNQFHYINNGQRPYTHFRFGWRVGERGDGDIMWYACIYCYILDRILILFHSAKVKLVEVYYNKFFLILWKFLTATVPRSQNWTVRRNWSGKGSVIGQERMRLYYKTFFWVSKCPLHAKYCIIWFGVSYLHRLEIGSGN